jgi:hypothetical protein
MFSALRFGEPESHSSPLQQPFVPVTTGVTTTDFWETILCLFYAVLSAVCSSGCAPDGAALVGAQTLGAAQRELGGFLAINPR